MTHSITDAVTKAQHYLETNIYTVNDIYCLAITSYALAIRNSSYFDAVFNKLGTHAVERGKKTWNSLRLSLGTNAVVRGKKTWDSLRLSLGKHAVVRGKKTWDS